MTANVNDMPNRSMSQERWVAVPGHEGSYEVSDHGRVRSLPRTVVRKNRVPLTVRGRILKLVYGPNGYTTVKLPPGQMLSGTVKVHALVLTAFVGPKPPGMECCHANDIPDDNRLENLRWDTPVENAQDKVRNGSAWWLTKPTECPHGHKYTPENVRIKQGRIRCRACQIAYQRNHRRTKALSK